VAGVHGFAATLTSFVGREDEMASVASLLGRGRLVTVAGPGGVGKTRLAAEVARRVADRFTDGAWLVELAGVADPALAASAVASALSVPLTAEGSAVDALVTLLAPRQLLLVLDNCEHLLPGLDGLCGALLQGADDVRVLATSREPLGVSGESRHRLGPLRLPTGAGEPAEAVELFADRARMADPGFSLDGPAAAAVVRLVTRLDGLPLAIELAAARVEALGVGQLADRLEEGFRLLDGPDRMAAERHRTLAATAEWSYRLLDEPDRRVFRMLSVLPGPFTLEAARAVAGPAAEPAVLRLVDCSLLTPPRAGADGRARYLMLQTLRDYSYERLAPVLGELAEAGTGLADYAVQVAEQAAAGLATSTRELEAARWLDAEDALVHAALAWALEHDAALAVRLAVALTSWWSLRGRYAAGRELLSAAGRSLPRYGLEWCTVQVCVGRLTTGVDEAAAVGHFSAAVDALAVGVPGGGTLGGGEPGGGGPAPVLVEALAGSANCLINLGRIPEAVGKARSALDLAREIGYRPGEVRAMWWLGSTAYYTGDHLACLGWWRAIQRIDPACIPGSLVRRSTLFLAIALAETGELAEGRGHGERALDLAREAGALFDQADALMVMASIGLLAGCPHEARAYLCEAAELTGRIGNALFVFDLLDLTGHLCVQTGRYAEAVTVWAADAALREAGGIPIPSRDAQRREEALREVRQALGPQQAGTSRARGAVMTLPLAADYAALLATAALPGAAGEQGVAEEPGAFRWSGAAGGPAAQPLSTRERELVTLVAQGHTNAQIAQQLYISVRTVGSHLDRIRDKTGCRRRADLTRLALQAGLV
jgi:predicted ATPase/DNA-binding CsgD family transcriptional regulator